MHQQQAECTRLSAESAERARQLAAVQREAEEARSQLNHVRADTQGRANLLDAELTRYAHKSPYRFCEWAGMCKVAGSRRADTQGAAQSC